MSVEGGRGVPGGVLAVSVLATVVGIVQLVGGVLMLIFSGDVHGYSATDAVIFGIVTIVVGLIYLWVGSGLRRLSAVALTIGLIVSGFRFAYDIGWLLGFGLDGIGLVDLATLIFNGLVFGALWSGRGAFERSAPARSA